jgi:hypothetical protein
LRWRAAPLIQRVDPRALTGCDTDHRKPYARLIVCLSIRIRCERQYQAHHKENQPMNASRNHDLLLLYL